MLSTCRFGPHGLCCLRAERRPAADMAVSGQLFARGKEVLLLNARDESSAFFLFGTPDAMMNMR